VPVEYTLAPSSSEGKLYFYKDSIGAGFIVYRLDPARDTYASAPVFTYLTGFSVIGDRAYESTAAGDQGPAPERPAIARLSA
jgi:hypothetical protein